MRKITFGKTIIAVTAVFGLVAATPPMRADDKDKSDKHHAQAGKQSPEKFIKEAMEANQLELRAAQLAQRQGESQQVKQLASTMVQHHRDMQQQLEQFAEEHKVQQTGTQQLTGKHQQQWSKLQGKTGQELDKAFVTFVVKDHKKDIAMLEKCSKEFTSAPELKAFIDRNIPVVRQHLEMAQSAAEELNIDPSTLAADTSEESETAAGAAATAETGTSETDTEKASEEQDNEPEIRIESESSLQPDNKDQPDQP